METLGRQRPLRRVSQEHYLIGADRWILSRCYPWHRNLWKRPKRYFEHKVERFVRGYSKYDAVEAYGFIADAISNMVYQLFLWGNSYPPNMTHQEWLGILLDIRDGFSTRNEDGGLTVPLEAWILLRRNFQDLWD